MMIVILIVMVWVALSPTVVYAPVPRNVLYFLMSFSLAIMFGAEAAARFELTFGPFTAVCGGAAALCLITLVVLTKLSSPEEKIAVYQVYDESGNELDLQWKGAVEVPLTSSGLQVTKLISENSIILIFPEQAGEVELRVRKSSEGPVYFGLVTYAGSRKTRLVLGKELKTTP
jgi:hypothetical protein